MESKFTIIICTLNNALTIANLLDKLHKNMSKYEIIVIDASSEDETREIVEKYEYIKLFKVDRKGKLQQLKLAISLTNTTYFSLIDADDSIERDDLINVFELIQKENLDGVQFKTTSKIESNNYWQNVWRTYFDTIYIANKSIKMLGRPCITKTQYYIDLDYGTTRILHEDTYLEKQLIKNHGILNYKVVPYYSQRWCEDSFITNWNKWLAYGKGDTEITNKSSLISCLYHLFVKILIIRTAKVLFSRDFVYAPGIFMFGLSRIIGFTSNFNKIKF